MRLMVGTCSLEARQKRMMDIDDLAGKSFAKRLGEDLHVPRENDQVDTVLVNKRKELLLTFEFGLGRDGKMKKWHLVVGGEPAEGFMIGDDRHDVGVQRPQGRAKQKVIQTVAILGNHDEH